MVENHSLSRAPITYGLKGGPRNRLDMATPFDESEVYLWFIEENFDAPGEVLNSGLALPAGISVSTTKKARIGSEILTGLGISASVAYCVEVKGNSMEPVMPSGSTVAINTTILDIEDGRMYAIAHDGQLRVKILFRLPGHGVRLRSYNREDHADEEYTLKEAIEAKIKVLGRVFFYSVTL